MANPRGLESLLAYQERKYKSCYYVFTPKDILSLIGLLLSCLTKIKLITDLKDPWFLGVRKPKERRSLISNFIEKWLERKIMKKSDRIVTTTENYTHFLQQYYSPLHAKKFHTVWNGYDEEDFKEVEDVEPDKKFNMSYLGTFYYGRTPKEFSQSF